MNRVPPLRSMPGGGERRPGNKKGTNPGPPDRTGRTRRTASVLRTPPRVLNSTAANCGPPFGTKRPQVQILSPRPVFPQARGPAPSRAGSRRRSPYLAEYRSSAHPRGVQFRYVFQTVGSGRCLYSPRTRFRFLRDTSSRGGGCGWFRRLLSWSQRTCERRALHLAG